MAPRIGRPKPFAVGFKVQRKPEIDHCYLSGGGYMFPRRDGIILGGTWDHDDWSLAPNPRQTTEIPDAHAAIMKDLKG